jgi:hypothetical protein
MGLLGRLLGRQPSSRKAAAMTVHAGGLYEPPWSTALDGYHEMEDLYQETEGTLPAAAMAGLLQQAKGRWDGKVTARTSVFDLLFTLPGDAYPFETTVRVSHAAGVEDIPGRWPRRQGRRQN